MQEATADSAVPATPDKPESDLQFLTDLQDWSICKAQLAVLKNREADLRKKLFNVAFPSPVEGTNRIELPHGWKLKGTYKIQRDVDEATLDSMRAKIVEANVVVDEVVNWKPSLSGTAYKNLTAEQKLVFDRCLIIKPGSPTLDLEPPKGSKSPDEQSPVNQVNG